MSQAPPSYAYASNGRGQQQQQQQQSPYGGGATIYEGGPPPGYQNYQQGYQQPNYQYQQQQQQPPQNYQQGYQQPNYQSQPGYQYQQPNYQSQNGPPGYQSQPSNPQMANRGRGAPGSPNNRGGAPGSPNGRGGAPGSPGRRLQHSNSHGSPSRNMQSPGTPGRGSPQRTNSGTPKRSNSSGNPHDFKGQSHEEVKVEMTVDFVRGPDGEKMIKNAHIEENVKDKSDNGGSVDGNWYKNWIVEWQDEENDDDDDEDDEDGEEGADDDVKHEKIIVKKKKGKAAEVEVEEDGKKKKKSSNSGFGDVWTLVQTYCKDWEDTPLDIATFFFCLAAFNRPKRDKKLAVFDERLILRGYHYAQYAFAAYKEEKKGVSERLPFLKSEDYITGNWNKEVLKAAPAWYCALDHDEKAVILALRGTKNREDILVDLACQFVKWKSGYAHRGFVQSLTELEPFVLDMLREQMNKNPGYRLRVVGHSMGAAVSALCVLKWRDDFPNWDVYGYGYATPCCISGGLLETSKQCFTTFVHHFDAVSRLSMGSIEDLHHGMRLFIQKIGRNNNGRAILHALNKLTIDAKNEKVLAVVGEIDQIITQNLSRALTQQSGAPTHLFPAGETYQLWREKRGKGFTTWEMYQSAGNDYGRLYFSPTMLKDHGNVGYTNAFENLLAISVIERKMWLKMTPSKREVVRAYWNSFAHNDPYHPEYEVGQAVANMNQISKFKRKALDQGMIRPFLFLVSMSPKRRAAIGNMLGINLTKQNWYSEFNSHHEAWYLLSASRKGAQARGNDSLRTMNPLAHNSNWYMIVRAGTKKVIDTQGKFISKDVKKMMKNKKLPFKVSLALSQSTKNNSLATLEEISMLVFYSLTDQTIKDPDADVDSAKSPRGDKSPRKPEQQQQQSESSGKELQVFQKPQQLLAVNQFEPDPVLSQSPAYLASVSQLKTLGFTLTPLIDFVAKMRLQESGSKRANEVYSWGDVYRHKDERIKKKEVAGVAGLTVLGGALMLSALPMLAVAPPLAIVPLGIGMGVGALAATKSTPGGLVALIVACLQQRIALAFHNINIEPYYALKQQ